MIRSYKVELNPNKKQIELFNQASGTARFIYNWGLDRRITEYKENKKLLSYFKQNKELTELKHNNDWMYNVPKSIHQMALINLDGAFKNFFKHISRFPKFKSKHKSQSSFQIDNDRIYITNNGVKLQKLGFIKFKEYEYIPTQGKYTRATISKTADRWYISVGVHEEDKIKPELTEEIIGVDLGIKALATCSNGMVFDNPKVYKKYLNKLKKEQRKLSRKQKGSNNRNKQKIIVQRIHKKIVDIRHDNINKLTTALVKTKPKAIVIEDLNNLGMIKNHKLAQALSDSCFGLIRQQLEYKTERDGIELILANKFFPSSKTCSNCGNIKTNLTLSDRQYHCDICGFELDRDLNAAINLKNLRLAKPEVTLVEIFASG
jgi:putative transposase